MKSVHYSTLRGAVLAAAIALSGAGAFAQPTTDATPGWTGSTLVPGSHSSIASDAPATRSFQTGQY
jgi:hypothetical protein